MLTTLLVALGAVLPAPLPGETRLHWRGQRYALDELPAELPDPAREALELAGDFAAERELELHLDPDARVLYVAEKPSKRSLELIARTLELFERQLPPPEGRAPGAAPGTLPGASVAGAGGASRGSAAPIPEDPGGTGGVSLEEALGGGAPKPSTRWGASAAALDRATAVLLRLDPEQYAAFVDLLVQRAPALAAWGAAARSSAGFALEDPLSGAYVMDVVNQEEFDPDGELVHRLADLLLVRRFGRQPYWLVRGIAWSAEYSLRKEIWCYPYRDEFVYTVEHAGWPADVRGRMKKEFKDGELTVEQIAGLRRGKWSGEPARLAFATAHWMLTQRAQAVPALLEDLRLAYEAGSRRELGGGAWERDVDYEVPPSEVATLMRKHLGEEVFAELTDGLRSFR